jgi:hypothetical protein
MEIEDLKCCGNCKHWYEGGEGKDILSCCTCLTANVCGSCGESARDNCGDWELI